MAEVLGVALVTGAGSGIGRQLVIDLVARGWMVAGLDSNPEGLAELECHLAHEQRNFVWGVADVTDVDSLGGTIGKMEDRLGPIDLLITCAGVANWTPAVGMDAAAIARIISVNLIGASNTIAAVLPGMLARRSGHIVAVSSLASFRGLPGLMGYCASKAGLNVLMQSLGLDVRRLGIRVTTVCPGHTHTPQATPMYREESLRPVAATAREILRAIDKRKWFHAFPLRRARQLRLMRLLPEWLQGWLLRRALGKMKK